MSRTIWYNSGMDRLDHALLWAKENPPTTRRNYVKARREVWLPADEDKPRAFCPTAAEAQRRAWAKGSKYTQEDVKALLVAQSWLCCYCQTPLKTHYHIDHVVPLSRGGSNGADNIAIACIRCNCSKGNKLLGYEWCSCKSRA